MPGRNCSGSVPSGTRRTCSASGSSPSSRNTVCACSRVHWLFAITATAEPNSALAVLRAKREWGMACSSFSRSPPWTNTPYLMPKRPCTHFAGEVQGRIEAEPERGTQDDVAPGRAPSLRREIVGAHATIRDDLVEVMPEIAIGRVIELIGQRSDCRRLLFRDVQTGMRGFARKPPPASKQPDHPIAAPVPAPQHTAVKQIAAFDPIRFVLWRRDHGGQPRA